MAATPTVLHPNVAAATFAMDDDRHMPVVMERFGARAMTGRRVVRFEGPPVRTPGSVMATLAVGGLDGIAAALEAEGAPVLADVPRCSDQTAVPTMGEVRGHV